MAWDEWEQLKSEAAERRSTHMRLNQLAASDGGGGGGDLVVQRDDLGVVGHEAHLLFDDLRAKANIAAAGSGKGEVGSTMQAAAALKSHSFQMGSALEMTVEMWTSQVKSVLQACAHISNHLDYSKKRHSEDDAQIAAVLRSRDGSAVPASTLNEYFK
ncbi:hypothetical protein [Streptomyces diastatochromogenes]|uniref:AG1 protein n=1 Tax=Streptomyces diastatochromogenes TaxID=42236 RepID=A0A233S2Y9_STRDA|nr:hypothetical protein [Streptomyces diastatochromogenes]MCZ0986592.1 hypothetical protein [Streptomyces diastatochromogenes]OXY89992.1 hypothetical protein BEK98_35625 [Streptomyces diastatochromogenes]